MNKDFVSMFNILFKYIERFKAQIINFYLQKIYVFVDIYAFSFQFIKCCFINYSKSKQLVQKRVGRK